MTASLADAIFAVARAAASGEKLESKENGPTWFALEAPEPAAPAPMDWEPVIAAVSQCMQAGHGLLALLPEPQENCGAALAGIAEDLAEALHATLSWIAKPDVETGELLAALEGYLP